MAYRISVGIIAPSSVVPEVELKLGVQQLKDAGFLVKVHPQCKRAAFIFSGSDDERARAFYDYAVDPSIQVLWCARGGYGANHLLAYLEKMTEKRGIPEKKLLVGYSDATLLMEFARARWGWSTLHAPMPGLRNFGTLEKSEWKSLVELVNHERPAVLPWKKTRLDFLGKAPKSAIRGKLIGGNLSAFMTLIGTPFAPAKNRERILFLEDIDESLSRIDRMVRHLMGAGIFERVKAVVLGNFLNCRDYVPLVLKKAASGKNLRRSLASPRPGDLKPLRKAFTQEQAFEEIFREIRRKYGIPVATGFPSGHGPGHAPLPLGAYYSLFPDGRFELDKWDWL